LFEKACKAEEIRADYLPAVVESVTRMTPQEAAELLDLALVLFARENRDDDLIFRLLSTIRDSLAPKG
jgi:hypothetical protein